MKTTTINGLAAIAVACCTIGGALEGRAEFEPRVAEGSDDLKSSVIKHYVTNHYSSTLTASYECFAPMNPERQHEALEVIERQRQYGDGSYSRAAQLAWWLGDWKVCGELLEKGCAAGEPSSFTTKGYFLLEGVDGRVDSAKATECFRRAAEAGDLEGSLAWGRRLLYGRGVPKDEAAAEKVLKKAFSDAEKCLASSTNVCHALCVRGTCFVNGCCGLDCDDAAALRNFDAVLGLPESDVSFLDGYRASFAVLSIIAASESQRERAMAWLESHAVDMMPESMELLGFQLGYDNPLGGPDPERGRRYMYRAFAEYKKQAENNVVSAMYSLGRMYLNGRGCEWNLEEGVKWIYKAAEHGHEDAMELMHLKLIK